MSSLTAVAISSRKVIRYGIYLLILMLIARTVFNFTKSVYLKIFPPKPPGADFALGDKLPRLPFPEKEFPEGLSYKIETAEGTLPEVPNVLPVYEMAPIQQSLSALDDAKRKASALGFDTNGRPILETTPNIYIFQRRGVPTTLTMNIVSGIFSISYDVAQDPSILANIPLTPEVATDQVRSYLGNAGVLTPDLSKARITHEYIKAEGGKYLPEVALTEANLIKINMFRKNFGPKEEYISVTPEYPEANIWVIMGSSTRQIVAAEYHHYPINPDRKGTYPVKSIEVALQELKDRKAFLVSQGDNSDEIVIRNIYLAYYDPGQYAKYYQPVVVFEGDNGFTAYVPAVVGENYGADPEKE